MSQGLGMIPKWFSMALGTYYEPLQNPYNYYGENAKCSLSLLSNTSVAEER